MTPTHQPAPPRLSESPPPARWPVVLGWLLAFVSLAGLFLFNPALYSFYPLCIFHRTTGLLCPGCGGLRAIHQLLHGHLGTAFRLNALLVLSLPVLFWLGVRRAWRRLRNQPPPAAIPPAWFWCALAVVVVFGVLRNLPFVP